MNEKHVTEEQLVEMHVEPGAHPTLWEHVRGCPDCRHRSESLAAALDLAKRIPVPGLHPRERRGCLIRRGRPPAWTYGSAERRPVSVHLPAPRGFVRGGPGLRDGPAVRVDERIVTNTGLRFSRCSTGGQGSEILRGSPGEVFPKLENPVVIEQRSRKTGNQTGSAGHRTTAASK